MPLLLFYVYAALVILEEKLIAKVFQSLPIFFLMHLLLSQHYYLAIWQKDFDKIKML
jgi:hypothetical protein